MQFAPLRAPGSRNVSCKNPAVLMEMSKFLSHIFRETRSKITPLQYFFGSTHSLFLMHFTQISIRIMFKENNKSQIKEWPLCPQKTGEYTSRSIHWPALMCRGDRVICFRSRFSCSASCFMSTSHS